jgi:hypothetical protein
MSTLVELVEALLDAGELLGRRVKGCDADVDADLGRRVAATVGAMTVTMSGLVTAVERACVRAERTRRKANPAKRARPKRAMDHPPEELHGSRV